VKGSRIKGDLIKALSWHVPGWDKAGPRQTSVRLVGDLAEIRTNHLPKKKSGELPLRARIA
jgi:hypothetical protein